MNIDSLREEISIQLEYLDATVDEIKALQIDLESRQPTVRELAASAKFLADFYTGIENILKRICRCCDVEMPTGDDWHAELFARFCRPTFENLPVVFDDDRRKSFAKYRQFRHVVRQGYTMQLDWELMAEGLENIGDVYAAFKSKLHELYGV